jgi:class 3 adenylate cyclase/tetratricopeptide (TPR) repeat protein
MPSLDEKIHQIRAAIDAQESLRAALGDEAVDATVTALKKHLDSLLAEQGGTLGPSVALSSEQLLAQLHSYIPKQLADKIRATGQIVGERRHVTVIFADISGFTALSERFDAEDVATLVNDCLKELVKAVYAYEGIVDKFIGDCIMAVFGAPIAHEDDAERALRATLAMRENLQAFNRRWIQKLGEPLNIHIGVNSGSVIAGNMGNDLRMAYTVMGDTVNIASRLQDAAKLGQIFVSRDTYRLTRGAFAFQAMEPIKVKGKRDPLTVYELTAAKIQPEKARGVEGLISPLMGRDGETKLLLESLDGLESGRGSITMLYGEAGIGKSRLLAEIRQAKSGLTWLEGRCFAFSHALNYGPFLDLLRRYLGISDEHGAIEERGLLRSHLEKLFPGEPDVYPVLGQLLSLQLEPAETALVAGLVGESFRQRLYTIFEQLVLRLSAQKPVVILLEDMHWADQSSIDLACHLFSLTGRASLAIIGVSRVRQEPAEIWKKLGPELKKHGERVIEISLQPLSGQFGRDLVEALLGGHYLPDRLRDEILEKSGGNPFFLEEVLRALIERGFLERDGTGWKFNPLSGVMKVPDTLQGVLLSRLDRLSDETRQIVQKAAVIGRVFLYRVLESITSKESGVGAQIALLEEAELVRERSRLPEVEYTFKHALTQEVAYQTLLGPARKLLHQQVADAMESIFSARISEFVGILAYHYFRGEAWEKALGYSVQAVDTAIRLYAYPEAREQCRQAIECLSHLDDRAEYAQQRVDVIIRMVCVSLNSEAPETNLQRLLQAETVAVSLDDPIRVARVQLWMGRAHYYAGRQREAIGYFQKALAVAPELRDKELVALAQAVIGRALFAQGHFNKAQQILEQAIGLLEAVKNKHELLVVIMYCASARASLGNYEAGLSDLQGVLQLTRKSSDQNAEALAHTGLAFVHLVAGRYAEGIESGRQAILAAEKSGDVMFRYSSNSFIAWGLGGLGNYQEALKHWAAASEAAKPLGGRLLLKEWFAAVELEMSFISGNLEEASPRAQEVLALAQSTGCVIAEGMAERALGRALAAQSPTASEAMTHFTKSVSLLESIGAQFELARALLAIGEVQLAGGDRPGAALSLGRAVVICRTCHIEPEGTRVKEILQELSSTA